LPIVPRECCSLDIGTARAPGVNMLAVIGSLFVTSQLIVVYRAPVDPGDATRAGHRPAVRGAGRTR